MLQELYKEIILDHYRRPRHRHEIEGAEIQEHLNNPLCGDEVTVYANIRDEGLEVSFTGRGCAISQASASMLAERLAGKSRGEAEEEISAFLEMMRTEPNEDLGDLAPSRVSSRPPTASAAPPSPGTPSGTGLRGGTGRSPGSPDACGQGPFPLPFSVSRASRTPRSTPGASSSPPGLMTQFRPLPPGMLGHLTRAQST